MIKLFCNIIIRNFIIVGMYSNIRLKSRKFCNYLVKYHGRYLLAENLGGLFVCVLFWFGFCFVLGVCGGVCGGCVCVLSFKLAYCLMYNSPTIEF